MHFLSVRQTLSMSMQSGFCRTLCPYAGAFKTTALVGVGILRPVRTAAAGAAHRYSKATPATLGGASEIDADRDATAL
jgi:hypothetical protein